mmetsp:Transcript_28988/g.84616  ORF Transcript_28988/g.84616 Transcript_28988/m.84616 type:complete len:232 (+) Transcript_28988:685-1380(+)
MRLAHSEHERRLRQAPRHYELGVLEHIQALLESSPMVPHPALQSFDGLEVVGEDVQARQSDARYEVQVPTKVRCEALHQQLGTPLLEVPDRSGDVVRTLVWQVVAVDACEHDVVQTPFVDGLGHIYRLLGIQRGWLPARLYGAKTTSPSASVAHDHDGGRGRALLAAPAFANVRAVRLLADRRQLKPPHRVLEPRVVLSAWNGRLEPTRLGRPLPFRADNHVCPASRSLLC